MTFSVLIPHGLLKSLLRAFSAGLCHQSRQIDTSHESNHALVDTQSRFTEFIVYLMCGKMDGQNVTTDITQYVAVMQ